MTFSYHICRALARPRKAAKRRAPLGVFSALGLAAVLSGCAVSMPMPGFIDQASTGAVETKAIAVAPLSPATAPPPKVATASPPKVAKARRPVKPAVELAATAPPD